MIDARNFRILNLGLMALGMTLVLSGCGLTKDMSEMHDSTLQMNKTTEEMNQNTKQLLELTKKMADTTADLSKKTSEMNNTTKGMAGTTTEMNETTKGMAGTTTEMNETTKGMAKTTIEMNETTKGMAKTTIEMNETTKGMAKTTIEMNETTKGMAKTTIEMNETTKDMAITTTKMHDLTKGMAKTTSHMDKVTGELKGLTVNMNGNLKSAFKDQRMSDSSRSRRELLVALKNEPDIDSKFIDAGSYFYGMEFQFWEPSREAESLRLTMMNNMVKEFLGSIKTFVPDLNDYDISDFFVSGGATKRFENLYVLVAAMHVVNEAQTEALEGQSKYKPVSMLSMIEAGLQASKLVQMGQKQESDLPLYQKSVRAAEKLALYLLQMRQAFIRSVVVNAASLDKHGNQSSHFSLGVKSFFGSDQWTPNFAFQNESQINLLAEGLEFAVQTARFLKSLGVKPIHDETYKNRIVDRLFNGIDLRSFDMSGKSDQSRALVRFRAAYVALKEIDASFKNKK